jgi:hypothetical protein
MPEGSMTRFRSLSLAYDFADRATTSMLVLMGDTGYWVCTPRKAELLISGGHEVAPRP